MFVATLVPFRAVKDQGKAVSLTTRERKRVFFFMYFLGYLPSRGNIRGKKGKEDTVAAAAAAGASLFFKTLQNEKSVLPLTWDKTRQDKTRRSDDGCCSLSSALSRQYKYKARIQWK